MRLIYIAISLLLLSFSPFAHAHNAKIPKNIKELALTKISDSIYVVYGALDVPNKENEGFMSNTGIILTPKGVVIVDTGGSAQVAKLVIKEIKSITDKPVIAIFNTHLHGDHWLGNAEFLKAFPGAPIYAHQRAIERLEQGEDQQWLDVMMNATKNAVAGTTLAIPNKPLQGGETLKIADTQFNVYYKGIAHSDNDIMIELPGQRTLFAGDIIQYERMVTSFSSDDFSALGQIKALEFALGLPVDMYIPGHGVAGGKEIPKATIRFLDTLYKSVEHYYHEGLQDFEMRDKVVKDMAEFSDWAMMDRIGNLISFIYQQVEAADF